MVECPDCHRTGFTEEELSAHQGGKTCVDLTPREAVEHTLWTVKWGGDKVTITDAAHALAAELAAMKAKYGELEGKVAELAAALEAAQSAEAVKA